MTRCPASSSEKPRSRNTLPLDGVTFSLLFAGIGPSPVHERAQAILGELQIVFRRLARALLDGVEDSGFGWAGPNPLWTGRRSRPAAGGAAAGKGGRGAKALASHAAGLSATRQYTSSCMSWSNDAGSPWGGGGVEATKLRKARRC